MKRVKSSEPCICGEKNPDEDHLHSRNHYSNFARTQFNDLSLSANVNGDSRLRFFFNHENDRMLNIRAILMCLEEDLIKLLAHVTSVAGPMDFKLSLVADYIKNDDIESVFFHSDNVKIFKHSDFAEAINDRYESLVYDTEVKDFEGSNWTLLSVIGLYCDLASYQPIRFGCGEFTSLPDFIRKRRGVINMRGTDNMCFLYSILADKYGPSDPINRHYYPSFYRDHLSEFKIDGLSFPISLDQIVTFSSLNREYSFNLFSFDPETSKLKLEFQTKKKSVKAKRIHLLILEGDDDNLHFALIKNLSRLFSSQISGHNGRVFFCEDCLNSFHNQSLLDSHTHVCEDAELTFPTEGCIEFKNWSHKLKLSCLIYFDLETTLSPRHDKSKNQNIEYKHRHEICGYAYLMKTRGLAENDEYFKDFRIAFAPEPEDLIGLKFLGRLRRDVIDFYNRYLDPEKDLEIIMNDNDVAKFNAAKNCEYCGVEFTHEEGSYAAAVAEGRNEKVILKNRHHYHCGMTNKPGEDPSNYLNALCTDCNLNTKQPRFVVATSHNLSFDFSLLLKSFLEVMHLYDDDVLVCARSNSRYISAKWLIKTGNREHVECRLIDSLKFNPGSLKKLAESLEEEDLVDLKEIFKERYRDLAFKQTMCYAFFSSPDKFKETTFPSIDEFKDELRGGATCSESEYLHALKIFNDFKKEKEIEGNEPFTMQDYYSIYLKVDVLLLAAVFERQRKTVFEFYQIDPPHYTTLPSMSFDLMLHSTKIKLDYIKDANIYSYIRRCIRGGITGLNQREVRPKNEELGNYDSEKDEFSQLIYVDINSSYAYALSSYLPTNSFKYIEITSPEMEQTYFKEIESLSSTASYGFLMELDLKIDEELHDILQDFPPICDHIKPPGGKFEKLMCCLYDREKYVCFYENFQMMLRLRIRITKIHSVVRFEQSDFMKSFIDYNIKQRNEVKERSKIMGNNFKLINNAVFGRSIMKQEYRDIRLTTQFSYSGRDRGNDGKFIENDALIKKNAKETNKQYRSNRYKRCSQWYYSHPGYRDSTPISDTGMLIELAQVSKKITVPIYLGAVCLEKSKITMLNFVYDFLHKSLKNYNVLNASSCTARIIYYDTDSYFIKTTGVRFTSLVKGYEHFFDTSNCIDEILQREGLKKMNSGRLGAFKFETGLQPIVVGIFLAEKHYMYKVYIKNNEYQVIAKCAGTGSFNISNLMQKDYEEGLDKYKSGDYDTGKIKEGRIVISKNCEVNTIVMQKKKLNNFSNKRWSHDKDCNITLPWGHIDILRKYGKDFRYDKERNEIYEFKKD